MEYYERRYKETLQRAKHALDCDRNGLVSTDKSLIYSMFPELKEKFKVGDWIVNNKDNTYGIIRRIHDDNTGFEKDYHLWTIQDANDGDVLVDNLGNILIYQEPSTRTYFHSYCYYYTPTSSFIATGGSHEVKDSKPATKEQRDQLEKAMFDAGYKWNKEKLKLEKI